MRLLVLGAGGQIANAVVAVAPTAHIVIAKSRKELDISNADAVMAAVAANEIDWLINAAAYTAVDLAESERDTARLINEVAVGEIAHRLTSHDCRLLHLSTDFVFDGRSNRAYLTNDAPAPLSVYGETKLGGEQLVLSEGDALVLRTAWVYATGGRNFVLTMLRLLQERDEVRVVSDQIGTPTWATGIGRAIWALVATAPSPGIYHWTDLGIASWYDFAVAIQDEALARGMLSRAIPIVPISTEEYPTPARRPRFSVLDTRSTRACIDAPSCHWRKSLKMMLDELRTK